jgi:hypothetical protein
LFTTMPPTIPESEFEAVEGTNYETSNIKKYVYNIKFEVVMKEGTKTIPGKASLVKAMKTIKNAKRKTEKIDFFDTNGQQISPDLQGIDNDDIEGRFCMEIGGSDDNNLFFACTIQTTIAFSILKGRTIDEFKKHNIYFKIHKGGFKYGVNWSPIGFFLKQHPGFIDTKVVRGNMMQTIAKSWYHDKSFFDDEQKTKIAKTIEPEIHHESLFDPHSIPFEVIQTTISAKNSENDNIRVNAVAVTIPYQFFKVGITIMDHLAIATETIENYIPFGYKKEEPDNFFNIVHNHAKWIQTVRHISITNVPTNQQFKEDTNPAGKTLEAILEQIPDIENIGYIRSKHTLQVATPANKVKTTTEHIKQALQTANLPYIPQVAKKFNPNGSLGSSKSGTSKYSSAMAKYQTERSPNGSIATSNGEEISRLTGYTGRSWGTQKKIPREIDFTDETQFPSMKTTTTTQNDNKHTTPMQSNTLDDSITDTTIIQQAIDAALKKAYEEHKKELSDLQDKFNKQLEVLQRQQNTTTLENKFDKLMEMLLLDKNTYDRESPIRKKGRPNNLNNTAFATNETPTRSNRNHQDTSDDATMTDLHATDEPPMGPHFHQQSDDGNANISTNHDETSESSDSSENDWITKTRKEKKFPKMTQTKLVSMMHQGGYGQTKSSPPRKYNGSNQQQFSNGTPPRPGRGGPPRSHHMDSTSTNLLKLTKLPSSRGGHTEPQGREN